MGAKPTLYELLGVPQHAGVSEIQAACQRKMALLESARSSMPPQAFDDQNQLLRVALSTLMDSATRFSYDAKLNAREQRAQGAVVPRVEPAPVASVLAQVQADALSLRADALALRADAMMIRAGVHLADARAGGPLQTVASGAVTALKRIVSAIGLLVVIGIGFFVATRFFQGGNASVRRPAMEVKANEQIVLQEYYQTHGVKPASLAELELLKADQRRRENESKLVNQDREKQDREARRFEEESRRRADQVSEDLRRADEAAKREAERQRVEDLRKKELERQQAEAEQRRIERERAHWQEVLRR
jgi:hypothetical protein